MLMGSFTINYLNNNRIMKLERWTNISKLKKQKVKLNYIKLNAVGLAL